MDRKEAQRASAVPVTATQGAEARNWSWVEASVWTERMVSALENGVKGGRWYSLMDKVMAPATLEAAWDKVQANGGAAGVDRQSIERFDARAELYLAELSTALRDGSYRPQPIRRVEIPKGEGKTRPLGIPTVKDRIVQTAVKFALEPIFEAKFRPTSYGFRPRRGCRDALREVAQLIEAGHTVVVDADFQSYFDIIAHDRLLANIYLHPLDELMEARGYRMVRYADDFVVLCKSREEADAALAKIRTWVAENGLRLHPNKTHIGDCRQPGEGFEFLGYRFEAGRRFVRKKSLDRLKDNIRARTRRTRGQSLARIIDGLNSVLKGWFAYFKHAHPRTFIPIDKFIRRRLRSILLKQTKKQSGFGLSRATHQRWPNAFFAQAGLLALHTAWLTARHSR